MTIKSYLSIAYAAEGTLHDEAVEALVKGERVGSGFGFGTRDLEFAAANDMTQEALDEFAAKLVKAVPGVDFAVAWESWDDECDEDGPIDDLTATI